MENPPSDRVCRTCMSKGQNFLSVLAYESTSKLRISKLLMITVPQLHIHPGADGLPVVICGVCLYKLNVMYRYQQLCIQTDRRLKAMLLQNQEDPDDEPQQEEDHLHMNTKQEKVLLLKETDQGLLVHDDSCIKIENELECQEFLSDHEADRDSLFAKKVVDTVQVETEEDDEDEDPHDYDEYESDVEWNDEIDEAGFESKEFLSDHEKDEDGMFKAAAIVKTLAKTREDGGDSESDNAEIDETGVNEIEKPDVRYSCPDCPKDFDQKYRLRRHIVVHSTNRLHVCDICKYRFSTENRLKRHKNSHSSEALAKNETPPDGYKCQECLRVFETRASLSAHLRTHRDTHRRAKPKQMFQCKFCPKKFIKSSLLRKHARVHPENQNFKCHFCGKVFVQNSTLKDHINTHTGEKPFLCSQCGKSFSQSNTLRKHKKRHSDEKPFHCEKCPKKFPYLSYLNKHMERHRTPICEMCGLKFATINKLNKHKKTHSGDLPYKCKECNMSFVLRDYLLLHMRKHTKQTKIHKCKYCDRAYTKRLVLQKHLRLHVGENTYMCDECPTAFKFKKELQLHKTQHYEQALIELEKYQQQGKN